MVVHIRNPALIKTIVLLMEMGETIWIEWIKIIIIINPKIEIIKIINNRCLKTMELLAKTTRLLNADILKDVSRQYSNSKI